MTVLSINNRFLIDYIVSIQFDNRLWFLADSPSLHTTHVHSSNFQRSRSHLDVKGQNWLRWSLPGPFLFCKWNFKTLAMNVNQHVSAMWGQNLKSHGHTKKSNAKLFQNPSMHNEVTARTRSNMPEFDLQPPSVTLTLQIETWILCMTPFLNDCQHNELF